MGKRDVGGFLNLHSGKILSLPICKPLLRELRFSKSAVAQGSASGQSDVTGLGCWPGRWSLQSSPGDLARA